MTTPRSSCGGGHPHAFSSPAEAIDALVALVSPVSTERVPFADAPGRILAEPILTDRPSPPADVTAMDGFAVRLPFPVSNTPLEIPITGECRIGREPAPMPERGCVRIVTGAPIPPGADAVIKREDVTEREDAILIDPAIAARLKPGASFRRRGENAPAGATVVAPGHLIGPPHIAAMATVGAATPLVYKRVRASILITGDELVSAHETPTPWQIRDSNGPTLAALLSMMPFVDVSTRCHAADDLDATIHQIASLLEQSDILLITGGVSMGDRDFVPEALRRAGATTIFHKLPQRPGRPVLAAMSPRSVPILALPGNPVSVMCVARRIAVPVIRARAGCASPLDIPPRLAINPSDTKSLDLWWHRQVVITGPSEGRYVDTMGSGDMMSAASAEGFVELPPHATGSGPWPFYAWKP